MSSGLIGLGTMGSNLAVNIAHKNDLHIFNRTSSKTLATFKKAPPHVQEHLYCHDTVEHMIEKMKEPRSIITMLPHGDISRDMIINIGRQLSKGDTIIDCANEHFEESKERGIQLNMQGINYLGVGVSGGEQGALNGPGVMIGGNDKIYEKHKQFFDSFCNNAVHVGDGYGAGHYSKMVHNGIEYGMMQGIADIFAYCNFDTRSFDNIMLFACDTYLNGYLVKSALRVSSSYPLENISDEAQMNNTGKWCSEIALRHNISLSVIDSAVKMRIQSRYKSYITYQGYNPDINVNIAIGALKCVFAMSMIEGLCLIENNDLDIEKNQYAWSSGCIISCDMVNKNVYELQDIIDKHIHSLRKFVSQCVMSGIPVPAATAVLNSYDIYNQEKRSTNFIMAQRNYFGNHEITCF